MFYLLNTQPTFVHLLICLQQLSNLPQTHTQPLGIVHAQQREKSRLKGHLLGSIVEFMFVKVAY